MGTFERCVYDKIITKLKKNLNFTRIKEKNVKKR